MFEAPDAAPPVARNTLKSAPQSEVPQGSSLKTTQPQTDTMPSTVVRIEAMELASNFILKTRLDPRVLSRSEIPVELASFGWFGNPMRQLAASRSLS
jgi:hypothetical protein